MITVGITGGIGSGKSTVCEIFRILKIPVYSADDRAKFLMNNNLQLIQQIKGTFGSESYSNNVINRDFMASQVFTDGDKIAQLNHIVHPAVKKDFMSWSEAQSSKYVVKEAALLIEAGSYKDLDHLIVVLASTEIRIQRVLKRDSFRNPKEIEEIMNKQTDDASRKEKADFLINNDDSELLIPQVVKIHCQLNQ